MYVCARGYAGKTVVGPSFMNGKRAFVISSPYLVTAVQMESFVYVAKNKNVAVKPGAETIPHRLQVKCIGYL